MKQKGFSAITVVLVVVIALILILLIVNSKKTPASTGQTPTPSVSTTASSTMPIENVTYKNTAHQFQFVYTSDWKQTDIFNVGLYKNAIAFTKVDGEAALKAEIKPTSDVMDRVVKDKALFVRIDPSASINQVIASLYGNGITVGTEKINNKNIAHVVHSKSTDPVNWKGGSSEAYIFRNSLGEAVILEANYSSEEPKDGELRTLLQNAANSLTLTSN